MDASFARVGSELKEKKLPAALLARHQAAEQDFRGRRTQLRALTQALEDAEDDGDAAARDVAVRELDAFLASSQQGPRHRKLDVKKLPWRVEEPTQAKPALTAEAFTLVAPDAQAPAASSPVPLALAAGTPPELAETEDVQLTPAVTELAASLGHDPVRIYNWVRNNVGVRAQLRLHPGQRRHAEQEARQCVRHLVACSSRCCARAASPRATCTAPSRSRQRRP